MASHSKHILGAGIQSKYNPQKVALYFINNYW